MNHSTPERDNRANQLNPNNPAYESSRQGARHDGPDLSADLEDESGWFTAAQLRARAAARNYVPPLCR